MPPEVLRAPDRGAAQQQQQQGGGVAAVECSYGFPADVWALGALAHELLLGACPFSRACSAATIQASACNILLQRMCCSIILYSPKSHADRCVPA